MNTRRRAAVDLAVAVLAGVLALAVYVRSLAPGLLWGDSAEFQFAAWLGGFAHPTGYPLYLMLGWLWTHLLPFGDPAFRMNLFSAFSGGVAVSLFCLLVMRLIRFLSLPERRPSTSPPGPLRMPVSHRGPGGTRHLERSDAVRATEGGADGVEQSKGATPGALFAASRLVAFGAALVFTFTPTFWSQAVVAEVYTLHAAFVAALLLALIGWAQRVTDRDDGGERRLAYLAALLFGFSLAHHRSTILLIPAAALFVVVLVANAPWRPKLSWRRTGLLALCLLGPLALYLVIPLRAPAVPYYRAPLAAGASLPLYDSTLTGFLAHVSGSVFSSSLGAPRADALDLARLAGRFADELSANGLLLGSLGLLFLIFLGVRERSRRAGAVLALTGCFFLVQVGFNLFYAIGDIFVFYIPAYLVWVLWIALGGWAPVRLAGWLLAGQGERAARWATVAASLFALAALAAVAYRAAVVDWPKVQRAGDDSARRAWEALLGADIPQGAILVSNDRDEMVPLWYLAYVEGRRSDLTGLFPLIQPGLEWSNVGSVVDVALQTGRPVYLVKPMPGLEVKYELADLPGRAAGPLGPAQRVASLPNATPSHATDVVYGDTIRLLGYDISPEPMVAGRPAFVTLYWEPLRAMREDWTTFVQVVDAAGTKVGQSDHHPGGVFYPTNLWAPGEQLRDTHRLEIEPGAPAGPRRLVVGLYVAEGGGLRQLGSPQAVGEVEVTQ